jgi:hypothetical protein
MPIDGDLASKTDKNSGNKVTPTQPSKQPPSSEQPKDFNTYKKHGMDYFTEQGVKLRTGLSDKKEWYLLVIRELLDNAIDFLTKYYKGASNTEIGVFITIQGGYIRVMVRNSNYNNVPILQNKAAIFKYDMTYGSKQYLYIVSRGMLGDALKQMLAFGYILLHLHDNGTSFQDKQWDRPLIIRNNGKEYGIYLTVDRARQSWNVSIPEEEITDVAHTDTEIELILPVVDEVKESLSLKAITDYCRIYPIFTTDITFRFEIFVNGDSSRMDYPALHAISTESWENQNSCHAYIPEEFKTKFVNMDPEDAIRTRVYDLLKTFREGSKLPFSEDCKHGISIAELCELPDKERDNLIKGYYTQLRRVMKPPKRLFIPYTTNTVKRKAVLINRLRFIYRDQGKDLDRDNERAAYKSIFGIHEDFITGIAFPYFIEILAVPFADPRTAENAVTYTGAVNYSVSPKEGSNMFKGNYDQYFFCTDREEDDDEYEKIDDIRGVLASYGFHRYAVDTAKIPCVVILNLVTPKRDPHGHDKSSIDITPFAKSIVQIVERLAADIKSYRARGLHFGRPSERKRAIDMGDNKKGALERMLVNYLRENRGFPE